MAFLSRNVLERRTLVGAGQDFPQPPVDVVFCRRGKGVERRGVDQVAQRETEHPLAQVELAQRSAVAVARAALGELGSKVTRAGKSVCEQLLVAVQQVSHERVARAADP